MSPAAEPTFKDHLSGNSSDYVVYRPAYPVELFAWLAEQSPERGLAWDMDRLMGYFATWSAVKAYRRQREEDLLPALRDRLAAWSASGVSLATAKNIKWPLSLRFGRIQAFIAVPALK